MIGPDDDIGFAAFVLTLLFLAAIAFLWACIVIPPLGFISAGLVAVWAAFYFILKEVARREEARRDADGDA